MRTSHFGASSGLLRPYIPVTWSALTLRYPNAISGVQAAIVVVERSELMKRQVLR